MIKGRLGRCYELAFNYFAEVGFMRPDMTLVHGLIRDTNVGAWGAVICHAWVEIDNECWEPITQLKLPKDVFMRLYDAEEIYRYNRQQVHAFACDTGHSGPWEPMPDHLQRTIPQIVQGDQP